MKIDLSTLIASLFGWFAIDIFTGAPFKHDLLQIVMFCGAVACAQWLSDKFNNKPNSVDYESFKQNKLTSEGEFKNENESIDLYF